MGSRHAKPMDLVTFMPSVRFAYRYRFRFFKWVLDEHVFLRELLYKAFPRAIRREIVVNERIIEVPYTLRSLDLALGSRVLDVGSRWSPLPFELAALGYRTVATDLDPFPVQGAGFDYVLADLRRPPFKPMSLDGITMVSTLEHVGVGFYDSHQGSDDDFQVVEALRELLRPGGKMVLTVPFGIGEIGKLQRSYDSERLARIARGWTVEEKQFFAVASRGWEQTTELEASTVHSALQTRAVALLSLSKPG